MNALESIDLNKYDISVTLPYDLPHKIFIF